MANDDPRTPDEISEAQQLEYDLMRSQQEGGYGASPMATARQGLGRLSQRKELSLEVNRLRHELRVKEELLKLLEDNPVIERFMDLTRGIL